jgi:DNA polymerase
MTKESIAELSREEICSQLSNWLKLLELSGTREIVFRSEDARGAVSGFGRNAASRRAASMGSPTAPGAAAASLSPGASGSTSLDSLRKRMEACTRCELHKTRKNVVFGEGNPRSLLIFIGEGPGRDEDLSGRPFVGRAGALLTKIIGAMGLKREDVYIANIVKCRPPENRNPEPDEVMECLPFLEEQVDLIGPKVICSLGNVATQTLTGERNGITRMRGGSYEYRGIEVIPTFHPAACLRNPGLKRDVWEDIKKIMKVLGLTT